MTEYDYPTDKPYEPEGQQDRTEWEADLGSYDAITADSSWNNDIPDDGPEEELEAEPPFDEVDPPDMGPETEGPNPERQSVAEPLEAHAGTLAVGEAVKKPATSSTMELPAVDDPEHRQTQRDLKRKIFFAKNILHNGSEPLDPQGQQDTANMITMSRNSRELLTSGSAAQQEVRRFISSASSDSFTTQEQSKAIVDQLLQSTEDMDNVDLVMACMLVDNALIDTIRDMSKRTLERAGSRLVRLRTAVQQDLVQAVSPFKLVGDAIAPVAELHKGIFGAASAEAQDRELYVLQRLVRDRLTVSDMVIENGLWTKQDGEHGESPYSEPATDQEMHKLNNRAADTIEGLHLLKAYGVTPFEVRAAQIDFPWDIAVMPPNDMQGPGTEVRHAEGAVADFYLLPPSENRQDIRMHFSDDLDKNFTMISLGDDNAVMRFRLHDNGQISYGHLLHNIPSDNAEKAFSDMLSGTAFQRMRGLFISLAFDAVVPDEVTQGRDIRGSVATTLGEDRRQPLGQRIHTLLLRRRQALRRADVSERQREPKGWDGPPTAVQGHFTRLPAGTRARPTAEAEAREYYESTDRPFNGLPEGHTFTIPHNRATKRGPVTYRRAHFRPTAATATYMQDMRRRQ